MPPPIQPESQGPQAVPASLTVAAHATSHIKIIAVVVAVVGLVASGAFAYMRYSESQQNAMLNVTDSADVVDYATCMSYARNAPANFGIVFAHGSDVQQLRGIQRDLQDSYPRAKIAVATEEDAVAQSIDINGHSVRRASDMERWKKDLAAQARPSITITAPAVDLNSGQQFQDLLTRILEKYPSATFQQYSRQVPSLAIDQARGMQKSMEAQCSRTYKELSTAQRLEEDIQYADSTIKSLVRGAFLVQAPTYFEGRASYAPGPLAADSGICSDPGTWGLKKQLDQLVSTAGAAYCYASSSALAVSAPLASDPSKGYCADSNGYVGITDSPMAAQQGYCVAPKILEYDLSACEKITEVRQRWGCVGDQLNETAKHRIRSITGPYAAPDADKIKYCKTLTGLEADYCYVSITQSYRTEAQPNAQVCANMSNTYPWFKADCVAGRP